MFTSEEIQELSKIFGITPIKEKYPVKDGFVTEDDMVWWHGETDLIHTRVGDPSHFHNVKECPNVYSIQKPRYYEEVKIIYTGDYET